MTNNDLNRTSEALQQTHSLTMADSYSMLEKISDLKTFSERLRLVFAPQTREHNVATCDR